MIPYRNFEAYKQELLGLRPKAFISYKPYTEEVEQQIASLSGVICDTQQEYIFSPNKPAVLLKTGL